MASITKSDTFLSMEDQSSTTRTSPNTILMAVDDSDECARSVHYVGSLPRDTEDVGVTLFHVLKPIPRELMEHGGSENPEIEDHLGAELRKDQEDWVRMEGAIEYPILLKALERLGQTGFPIDRARSGCEDKSSEVPGMSPSRFGKESRIAARREVAMDCLNCKATLPLKAHFCPSCGASVKTWEELMLDEPNGKTSPPPRDNRELRDRLIDCYLNFSISKELSEWLQDLGLPSTGTTQEKLTRLRQQAGELVLPAESFPRQTIYYLNKYDEEILSEVCQELRIDATGPKELLLPRIYREVGLREGWLQPLSEDARLIITETFIPILKSFDAKKDYYLDLWGELSDVLGEDNVRPHVAQAYGSAIIAVLIPGFFQEGQMALLQTELKEIAEKRFSQRTGRSSSL